MLLEVAELGVDLPVPRRQQRVVDDVSFSLAAGDSLGVVGESGSGKTMTALAMMGLLPEGAKVSGSIRVRGRDLARPRRGRRCSKCAAIASRMIFQEPMTALNPLHSRRRARSPSRCMLHRGVERAEARAKRSGCSSGSASPEPERARARLSASNCRAAAPAGDDRHGAWLSARDCCIADEPTTALDVTVQARILALIAGSARETRDGGRCWSATISR